MKIRKIKVHNLYSYYDAEFELDDYNVIVGPNGAGKTNLVRILNMLLKNGDKPLDKIELDRTQRLKPDEDSYLLLTLELTKQEIKAILQFLFHRSINRSINKSYIDDSLKHFTICLAWPTPLREVENPSTILWGFNTSKFLFEVAVWSQSSYSYLSAIVKDEYNEQKFDEIRENIDIIAKMRDKKAIQALGGHTLIFTGSSNISRYDSVLERFLETAYKIKEKDPLLKSIIKQYGSKPEPSINIDYVLDLSVLPYYKEIIDIIGISFGDTPISFFEFINRLISTHVKVLQQYNTYEELLKKIKKLHNASNYTKYEDLWKYMKELFNVDMKIMPIKEGEDDKIVIFHQDRQKYFKLEDSAAGYAEALNILSTILGNESNSIILDEPALNLHPSKIKQLVNEFEDLVREHGNQVILITHSPYFIPYEIVNKNSKANLIYVRKDNGISKSVNINVDEIGIKPHLFKPEIFFSTCTIIVEGSSDRAVLQAISDNFDNILENNDIVIIYVDGKKSIKPYEKILKDVIPYVVMKDKDNDDKNEDNNTILVEPELEDELCRLYDKIDDSELKDKLLKIWNCEAYKKSEKKDKPTETQAYEFIDTLMKSNEKAIIKDSKFWQVIIKALSKAKNKNEKEIGDLLEEYFK